MSTVVILQFKFHVSLSLQLPWPCILCQQAGGHGAIFPILLLRCHPLRTMRPSPPTTVTELQQGESHLGAFGTGTRRHWVILQSQCGWSCCPLWETISTHHLTGSQSWFDTRLSSWRGGMHGQGGSGKLVVCWILTVEWCSLCRCQGECCSPSSLYNQCLLIYPLTRIQHFWPTSIWDCFWVYNFFKSKIYYAQWWAGYTVSICECECACVTLFHLTSVSASITSGSMRCNRRPWGRPPLNDDSHS